MKIAIDELISEVKESILCYEEYGEKTSLKWEQEFYDWLKKNKDNRKSIKEEKGVFYFNIEDESEVIEIADSYIDAIEENSLKNYWDKFK